MIPTSCELFDGRAALSQFSSIAEKKAAPIEAFPLLKAVLSRPLLTPPSHRNRQKYAGVTETGSRAVVGSRL